MIVLNVVIPAFLALLGGILATKALPDDKRRERSRWIALFVVLVLIAIILAFIQQVKVTREKQEAEAKAASNEKALFGENKFTQGQLDSINKVLSSLVSGTTHDSTFTKDVIKALASTSKIASASAEHAFSNSQLRDSAIDLARRLRALQTSFDDASEKIMMERPGKLTTRDEWAKFNAARDEKETLLRGKFEEDFVPLRAEAINMRSQLLNRLPAQEENADVNRMLKYGALAGPHPLYELATYYEKLARLLAQ